MHHSKLRVKKIPLLINCGFFILGIVIVLIGYLSKPVKTIVENIYDYPSSSELSTITFPYTVTIPLTEPTSYIELHLGDNSLNSHQYSISLIENNQTSFSHTYIDYPTTAIQLPTEQIYVAPSPDQPINIQLIIDCLDTCNDVQFKLYDLDNQTVPEILAAHIRRDFSYFWYSIFSFVIGLTLLPFTIGDIKNAKK